MKQNPKRGNITIMIEEQNESCATVNTSEYVNDTVTPTTDTYESISAVSELISNVDDMSMIIDEVKIPDQCPIED